MTKPFLIGDQWRSKDRPVMPSIYPADGSVAAEVALSLPNDVDDAVNAARRAFEDPAWRNMPAHRRARLLYKLGDLIEGEMQSLARIQTSDNGKTVAESLAQAAAAADFFKYYAAVCETLEAAALPGRGDYLAFTRYEPVGVVASITPWNSPLTLEAQKLAPALAAGNAVVLKSSELTPQIGLEYGRLALEAGFPAGILNIVTGHGDIGQALIEHPGIDMITFTGGTKTGRLIAESAGRRGVPVLLELGGKSPNVIFDDAELDKAIRGAMVGVFHNCGQSCIAGSRLLVERGIYDAFLDRFVEATRRLTIGDPMDPSTDIAPLASFQHRERIEHMLGWTGEGDARILLGGRRPQGERYLKGAYIEPTIIVTHNDHPIAREEIFGPVACVIPFEDENDLVRLANKSEFGLACGVWTENVPKALRVGERINVGTVWINTYKINAVNVPFGGNKASGYGRECGIDGLRAYCQVKSFYVDRSERSVMWPPSFAATAK